MWKFHAIYWPAFLLSASLPLPDKVVVHGFVTAEGCKIGKSLGNAVDPFECVETFGADAVRYYLLRAIPAFGDVDFSIDRFKQLYQADLANGLGNLTSRLTSLCERAEFQWQSFGGHPDGPQDYLRALDAYEFDKAAAALWGIISDLNRQIELAKPWELLKRKNLDRLRTYLARWVEQLYRLAYWLQPLLPSAASRILRILSQPEFKTGEQLFLRLR